MLIDAANAMDGVIGAVFCDGEIRGGIDPQMLRFFVVIFDPFAFEEVALLWGGALLIERGQLRTPWEMRSCSNFCSV